MKGFRAVAFAAVAGMVLGSGHALAQEAKMMMTDDEPKG